METRYLLGQTIKLYETTGDFDLVEVHVPAGTPGPPPHLHKSITEFIIVTNGELQVTVEGKIRNLKSGDAVNIPINTVHTFNNVTDKSCDFFSFHSPKGFMKFFQTFGIPKNEPNAFERSQDLEIVERIIKTASRFDMDIKS